MSNINDYDTLAETYQESNQKPDKAYSILPTVMKLAGDISNKTVLDLGCGAGFFSRAFIKAGAGVVIGIDNSAEQIVLAQSVSHPNIKYEVADIFVDPLPVADVVIAPFILNYALHKDMLAALIQKIYSIVNPGGRLVLVCDLPSGANLKRFGAVKKLLAEEDESPIQIDLYNEDKFICSLNAVYYKSSTIVQLLGDSGFKQITMHEPIVSSEGETELGAEFWKGYVNNCELGYLTATK